MPTMKTTITLSENEMGEAITEYLRGKRYEVKGGVSFAYDPGDPGDPRGGGSPSITATATVEPIARKKRGSEEDEPAK